MMPEKSNGGYYVVRVCFCKIGSLRYISHLDLVRTLSKIVTRAKLPLWYTEGFNPKPKISYAAPLPLGVGSLCEYMDIRLTDYVPEDELLAALNRNMTEEMQALRVYYPTTKLTDLSLISYEIRIVTKGGSEALAAACGEELSREKIEILKNGKAGEHIVDIRPAIDSSSVRFEDGAIRIDCTLAADSAHFLSPELLIRLLKEKCGILSDPDLTREYYSVLRTESYRADGEVFA